MAGKKPECAEMSAGAEAEVSRLGLRTSLLALDTLLRLATPPAGFPPEEAAQDARLLARRMNNATQDMLAVLAKAG
jgi:hypothetical protein